MLLDPSNRADYSILSALRGPDDDNDALKFLFTQVLRYYVFDRVFFEPHWPNTGPSGEFTCHGALVSSPQFVKEVYSSPGGLSLAYLSHWMNHTRWAFEELDSRFPKEGIMDYFIWAKAKACGSPKQVDHIQQDASIRGDSVS